MSGLLSIDSSSYRDSSEKKQSQYSDIQIIIMRQSIKDKSNSKKQHFLFHQQRVRSSERWQKRRNFYIVFSLNNLETMVNSQLVENGFRNLLQQKNEKYIFVSKLNLMDSLINHCLKTTRIKQSLLPKRFHKTISLLDDLPISNKDDIFSQKLRFCKQSRKIQVEVSPILT